MKNVFNEKQDPKKKDPPKKPPGKQQPPVKMPPDSPSIPPGHSEPVPIKEPEKKPGKWAE